METNKAGSHGEQSPTMSEAGKKVGEGLLESRKLLERKQDWGHVVTVIPQPGRQGAVGIKPNTAFLQVSGPLTLSTPLPKANWKPEGKRTH